MTEGFNDDVIVRESPFSVPKSTQNSRAIFLLHKSDVHILPWVVSSIALGVILSVPVHYHKVLERPLLLRPVAEQIGN